MALQEVLGSFDSVVVGLSGGVDSTLLAVIAKKVLGGARVLCATAISASLGLDDRAYCGEFAERYELAYREVYTEEFDDERYLANDSMRCYYCKSSLMDKLVPLAEEMEATVVLGVNMDDLRDIRPGQRAASEAGARFPFVDAKITKDDIRELARWLGVETWDRPQAACLSSRIPFGTPVSLSNVSAVDRAERSLRRLGFRQVRVRHHGEIARVEVELSDLARVFELRETVVDKVRQAGFQFVAIDLEGFRSGSMHRRADVQSQGKE